MSNNQNAKIKEIKQEDIIFESEHGTNVIIDNENTYILSHKNGKCCCFDHERKILRRVIKAIKRDGNFQVNNTNTMGFYIADNKGKMRYNLAQLIVCVAYNKKLQNIQHHNVKYIDGNILNYCIDNLDCTAIQNSKKTVCNITHDDKLIFVRCNNGEKTGILDYSPELFEILSLPRFRWIYAKKANAVISPIYINQERKGNVSLHQLAYTYYNYLNVSRNNILSQINQLKLNCSKNQLQVDHLDSNRLNERQYNLSLMDQITNVRKSNITNKIVYPYFHYCVYVDGVYKVAIGMYVDSMRPDVEDEVKIQAYQCETADSYVELLRQFYDEGVFPNGECLPMSPKKWYSEMPEEKRQQIDQVLPKIDKEDLIDRLLKADNLPLYEGKKDVKYAS